MKARILLLLFVGWVQCLTAQIQYPPNIFPDTAHAPFLNGVASGDPTPSQVIIWTRIDPGVGSSVTVDWEISEDATFGTILQNGTFTTDASRDHTVHIDLSGLSAGTYYYYRFRGPNGNLSPVGRTHTAPSGPNTNVRFAIGSCSSVYSGWFNAYRAIGERDDIDAMIHLGDYIYDFVDSDEAYRVPVPDPIDPENLEEWRDRHEYYLLDPDLRLARQNHPWIVIWDNHDIDADSFPQFMEAVQAFQEYVPMRPPDANDPTRIYRQFSFGDLVDLVVLDYEQYYHTDSINGELSALSQTQRTWLLDELDQSTTQWRVIGNQKMVAQFSLQGFPSQIPFGDGTVADSGAWDGHNQERAAILNHLDQNSIDNNVFISGDIHMSFISDLAPDVSNYDDNTGAGSMAVEFIPSSITRVNLDERGFGGFIAQLALGAAQLANPQMVYGNLTEHGYGILDIRPDVATAEFFYHDKTSPNSTEVFAGGYEVRDGDNHWQRNATSTPTVQETPVGTPQAALVGDNQLQAYPNPTDGRLEVVLYSARSKRVQLEWMDMGGRKMTKLYDGKLSAHTRQALEFDVSSHPAGVYLLKAYFGKKTTTLRIVVE